MKEDNSKEEQSINDAMNIKIQKGSPGGVTDNKGSCRALAEYINHEDGERERLGLEILPFTTPDGDVVATEDVIKAIDDNGKGLSGQDNKFFHLIVSPSKEEIRQMGNDNQEVYMNSLSLIKQISDTYAQNFHRESIEDSSNLEIYWKPHFTRGDDGHLQFHIHGIVSRRSRTVNGKKLKLSPLTNHKTDVDGPIKGGFDRKAFYAACENIFDRLFSYEREVSKSFLYQNTIAHGSVEEKATQADRLAAETIKQMRESISSEVTRQQEDQLRNEEIDGLIKEIDAEAEFADYSITEMKAEILKTFASEKTQSSLFLGLSMIGVTCTFDKSKDGIEEVTFEKRGRKYKSKDIMTEEEHCAMLSDAHRITGYPIGEDVRETRAEKESAEMQKEATQHEYDGPSLGM